MHPIVLVGGKSRRFGRDKLREPVAPGSWMVDGPIGVLRAVFGPVVTAVGDCDPAVAARADGAMRDDYPGAGPAGGILTALSRFGDVFVLPGDVRGVDAADVRRVLAAADANPQSWAIVGESPAGAEPCIGVYRAGAADGLRACVGPGGPGLRGALPRERVVTVALPALVNVNTPEDLARARRGGGA